MKYFLVIEVAYSNQGIFISQQKYITDLLAEPQKIWCSPLSTPMDPNHKLCKAETKSAIASKMYQRLVRKLIYLVAHTWPNITHSISVTSQFRHELKESHLQVAYRILHYFKGSLQKGNTIQKRWKTNS